MPPCHDIQRGPPHSEIPAYMVACPPDLYHQTGEELGTAVILSSHKSIGRDGQIIETSYLLGP